jgi:hypothetical protein
MKKLDRLGWTAGISFRAYGVRIGVRVNRSEALDCIRDYLPPGSKLSASAVVERLYSLVIGGDGGRANVRRFHLLYGNAARVARSLDLESVLRSLESDSQFYIAEAAPRRVFVHAGVVGWRGRAVLIPGRSFSGKTTLVAELVRAGAVYYSDEYAVLDSSGLVHPYARPLAIREDGSSEPKRHSVESLGGSRGVRPLPVGLVVVTQYRAGARWRPRQLTPGRGVLALLDNTVSIQSRPEAAFPVLKQAASCAPFLKSERGDAKEIVNSIMSELESVDS